MSKSDSGKKILFAAGGTGGHLFPAQALAEQLQQDPSQPGILFVGANLSKSAWFSRDRFAFKDIASMTPFGGGIRRAASSLLTLVRGVYAGFKLLSKEKPDLIVGFGSFHTFPVLMAAALKNIPLVLFESNAIPGKVIRLFSNRALVSGIYFSEAKRHLKGKTVEVEIPVKGRSDAKRVSKEEARIYFNLDPNIPTVLVFGGSQGAKGINQKIIGMLPQLKGKEIQLIHMTGCEETAAEVTLLCQTLGIRCSVKKFESHMQMAWSAADVAICRSGAMTLSELLHYAVPGILIPFPNAADQHQLRNAECIAHSIGGAVCFEEKSLSSEELAHTLLSLIFTDAPKGQQMREAILRFKAQQKKADLGRLIIQLLEEGHW